jgi:hypothetical protein
MDAAWKSLSRKPIYRRHRMPKRVGVTEINHYIATQLALGNWPRDMVWAGDEALLAIVDTYDALASYA